MFSSDTLLERCLELFSFPGLSEALGLCSVQCKASIMEGAKSFMMLPIPLACCTFCGLCSIHIGSLCFVLVLVQWQPLILTIIRKTKFLCHLQKKNFPEHCYGNIMKHRTIKNLSIILMNLIFKNHTYEGSYRTLGRYFLEAITIILSVHTSNIIIFR